MSEIPTVGHRGAPLVKLHWAQEQPGKVTTEPSGVYASQWEESCSKRKPHRKLSKSWAGATRSSLGCGGPEQRGLGLLCSCFSSLQFGSALPLMGSVPCASISATSYGPLASVLWLMQLTFALFGLLVCQLYTEVLCIFFYSSEFEDIYKYPAVLLMGFTWHLCLTVVSDELQNTKPMPIKLILYFF